IKGGVLVIHNAKFDIGFLNSELKMANMPLIEIQKTIDTVHLAREKIPGAAASLDALCKRFEIDLSLREKHGALLDAKLLAEVYLQLTGGRQSSLSLEQEHTDKSKKVINKEEPKLDNLTFIEATLTEQEKEEHTEMINKINSSLWLK
ncbi:MAG: DNA polymerase III subunit epsilon, partial [Alphaproteobacteria bacterium]